MYLAHNALCCALTKLKSYQIEGLEGAIASLQKSVNLSAEYKVLFNSIFWNTAKPHVKRATREKLHVLAFNAYSELLNTMTQIDLFCDRQALRQEQDTPDIPDSWGEMTLNIIMAQDSFLSEHQDEIFTKQLTLL